jgi:mannose-6-phosphate isomerase-like protein (cupin superfamily)
MSKTIAWAGVVGAALLVSQVAGARDSGKGVAVPASELKWVNAKDAPGVQIAPVQGDPLKGPSKFFIRLPPSLNVGLHHHTADHTAVVVSGTMVFGIDGQERTVPRGSYFAFSGKKPHTTRCADPAGCTLFIDCHGKWDVIEEAAAKK